jgi:hypothetical protein
LRSDSTQVPRCRHHISTARTMPPEESGQGVGHMLVGNARALGAPQTGCPTQRRRSAGEPRGIAHRLPLIPQAAKTARMPVLPDGADVGDLPARVTCRMHRTGDAPHLVRLGVGEMPHGAGMTDRVFVVTHMSLSARGSL